jgi:hypothetical protein
LYLADSTRVLQLITSANSAIAKLTAINPNACKLGGATYTSCLGAQFNVTIAQAPGGFVHNPFLIEQLLVASITQIQKDYGVVPDKVVSLTPQFILPSRGRTTNGSR